MSQPKHISEIMHQIVLNNPSDPFAQILRHCPFIMAEMIRKGYISLDDLSDEEIERLMDAELEDIDIETLKRKEADHD